METEKVVLGKDGRRLSFFQSNDWMYYIYKKQTHWQRPRGEAHSRVKLTALKVQKIRDLPSPLTRSEAVKIGRQNNIHPSYVYHLRSSNPKVRKWKHLDKK